jgi:hypothetical protein
VLGDLRLGVRARYRRRDHLVRLLHVDAVVSSRQDTRGRKCCIVKNLENRIETPLLWPSERTGGVDWQEARARRSFLPSAPHASGTRVGDNCSR